MAPYLDGGSAGVRYFSPFRIDVRDERLWKGTQELKIRRKPFEILKHLTANPRTLVTQDELAQAVWGRAAMSGSLLRTHMSELRRLLGDGVIETVVGRGYRFLLGVTADKPGPTVEATVVAAGPINHHLIDRTRDMEVLQGAFSAASERRRQIFFVLGEQGIGKTALVDAFIAQIAAPAGAAVIAGSCVEQFGTGESYLVVLAALGAACRGPEGKGIVELLARHAPTWLTQMPGVVPQGTLPDLQLRVQATTQPRMLREFTEVLDVLAAERPVVLVLEDAQWADRATIDLVSALGGRRDPAHVMVIVTCRPAETARGDGLSKVIAELSARKQAVTRHLEVWTPEALTEYLAQRFPLHRFPPELLRTLHKMTAGNPLFCSALVDDLQDGQLIQEVDGRWQLVVTVADVTARRPDGIRQLINLQIDRLRPRDQRIVEAAGLNGLQFASDAVAHALELAPEEVDAACEMLANDRRFFRFVIAERSDGTVQSQYEFLHPLYRDAALARVPSATRRAWQRRMMERAGNTA